MMGYIEVRSEAHGVISIDITFIFSLSVVFLSGLLCKKGLDLFDFSKNRIEYERKRQENEKSALKSNLTFNLKTKRDYIYYISEAKNNGYDSFTKVLQYFKNNQFLFEKKKLKAYY